MNLHDYTARHKFRLWHNKFKKYLTREQWYLDMDGKIRFAEYPQGNGDNAADSVFIPINNQNIVDIEHCTGCKDKNDKLIFEGDIVKVKRCWSIPFINDKIEIDYTWKEADDWEVGYIIWGWWQYKYLVSFRRYDDYDDFNGPDHRYEVIGNINENFDLVPWIINK